MNTENFFTENLDIILIICSVLLSLIVIKLVTKILFKLIIVIIIFIASIFLYQTTLGTNIIDDISILYCQSETPDSVKCECFVNPIVSDLINTFGEQELDSLKTHKTFFINIEFSYL